MSDPTARSEVRLVNPQGLHARPSSLIVTTANAFNASVTLTIDGRSADCKSIMEVMMLASPQGTPVLIEARGVQAAEAVSALEQLIARGFGEA